MVIQQKNLPRQLTQERRILLEYVVQLAKLEQIVYRARLDVYAGSVAIVSSIRTEVRNLCPNF